MKRNGTIVSYTADEIDEMVRNGEDQTDWAYIDALTNKEVEASIDYEDEGGQVEKGIPVNVTFGPEGITWEAIDLGARQPKRQMTLRLDGDILDFFKGQGRGYQTRINAVLRSYVEAQSTKQDSDTQRKAS